MKLVKNHKIMTKKNPLLLLAFALLFTAFWTGCKETETPDPENEEEIITDVRLIFTPQGGGTVLTFTATDPDGEGPEDLAVDGPITLMAGTTYVLAIELENSVANESITEEVEEEADEHMFFFGWTNGLFSNPSGSGNIPNRAGLVNYNDEDADDLPLGLSSTWITGAAASGTFRVVLKHQPGLKTASSTFNDGESDVDLTWQIEIE